jgi:hypothetical protein
MRKNKAAALILRLLAEVLIENQINPVVICLP